MKIEKTINIDVDVDVTIDSEDIYKCFLTDNTLDSEHHVLNMLNDCAKFLNGIPNHIINSLKKDQHKIIRDFLLKSADKFNKHIVPDVVEQEKGKD